MSGIPDAAQLEQQVLAAAALVHAANAELSRALAAFAATGGWEGAGIRSIGHWADVNLGVPSALGAKLQRLGSALPSLPCLAAAFTEGAVSLEKAIAVVAVATPASDEKLTAIARAASMSQLARICAEYRKQSAGDHRSEAQRECRRGVTSRPVGDDLVEILAVLDPEEAATLLAAIDARVERAWRDEATTATAPRARSARRADALVELASERLVDGPDPIVRGERVEVRVLVDADVLSGAKDEGLCCIEGVGAVSPHVVRRLACDARIRTITDLGDGRFDLGRTQRLPSRRQRRALRYRDRGCRYPGCANRWFVDAHHAVPWELGGCSDLDNLVSLCPMHHRLFHEGGYLLDVLGGGNYRFLRPDGRAIEPPALRAEPPDRPPPVASPRAEGGGGRFDLDLTLTALPG